MLMSETHTARPLPGTNPKGRSPNHNQTSKGTRMIATKETANTANATGALCTTGAAKAVAVARPAERGRVLNLLGLGFPLLVASILKLWNLTQNGYSNLYYSVAVQSMIQSFHNFFFASYDPGGYISVDKPPVALWLAALSARVFGVNSCSLLLPSALAGAG